ncbi:MAG: zinc transporter ZupT [Synergistaceae bacterium]|nr:zinc transporter ZupT [Synergistaceae bacterium]
MDNGSVIFAFGLTLFAGLSTGIGSLLAFFAKRTNTHLLCVSMGFSAGVMIYVSFVEIFDAAKITLVGLYGAKLGTAATVAAFFAGMAVIAVIDKLVPESDNPHEAHSVEEMSLDPREHAEKHNDMASLHRAGIFTAIAIAIHNFPEGLVTFTSALIDPNLGIAISAAVAIHNIPEGIAVSVPLFYATGNRKKAFVYSFLSGLSEPLGALVGYALLSPFLSEGVLGFLFAGVAGIMVFISFDELLPAAEEYGEHHLSVYGMVGGMVVMAASLLLFID